MAIDGNQSNDRCSFLKTDPVFDMYHGRPVPDPFRWLEEKSTDETKRWVDFKNDEFNMYLQKTAYDTIRTRLGRVVHSQACQLPAKVGGRYFVWETNNNQEQAVLHVQKDLTAENRRVVLDPQIFDKQDELRIVSVSYSPNGQFVVYALSRQGSDRHELKIREVKSGSDYPEVLKGCRYSLIAWKKDNSGFFYNRFPLPGSVAPGDENHYCKIFWHELGRPQSEDELIFENALDKEIISVPFMSSCGRYLIIHYTRGLSQTSGNCYIDLENEGPVTTIMPENEAQFVYYDNDGTRFYFETDWQAPNFQIIAVDITNMARSQWHTVIPESDEIVFTGKIINKKLVVLTLKDAHSKLRVYDLEGTFIREIQLPTLGSIDDFSGDHDQPELFFSFSSYLYPQTTYHYNFNSDMISVINQNTPDFNASDYVTTQVFYGSQDGTRVPMFLTHKKDLVLNGLNPTILTGYGGFGISSVPKFDPDTIFWLENGGVWAVANIRGGGEYGRDWHMAGILERKQNVFNDFKAGCDWLIKNKYTDSSRLALYGRSNGGLLVAAVMLQNPDLCGAVVCEAPILDMLRYTKFSIGRYWIPEFGDPENVKEHFESIMHYSPLHNVAENQTYPPLLVIASDDDDRVPALHAKKFTATMLTKSNPDNVILLRIKTKTGHSLDQSYEETMRGHSEIYAFLSHELGLRI
ncbi:S9 family peptidase [bacterium]|nr:S9 family peptidase [bacterium]